MASVSNAIIQTFRNPNLYITRSLVVASGVTIYEGTLVSIDGSGNAVVAVTSARIAGVAKETKTAGETVTVYYNMVLELDLSGASITNVGATAYAADNHTVTLTPNTAILGPIVSVGTDKVWVHLTTRA